MFNDNFMWLWLHSNKKQNLDKCLYICLFLKYKFIKDQHSCATMNTVVMTRGKTPDLTATSVGLSTYSVQDLIFCTYSLQQSKSNETFGTKGNKEVQRAMTPTPLLEKIKFICKKFSRITKHFRP